MKTLHIRIFLVALLALAAIARADDSIPPLTPDEQAVIALGVDATAPPVDPGFDALFAHVLSWENQMKLWSAGIDRPKEFVQVAWLDGLVDGTAQADIGTDAMLWGRLIERGPAVRRAWLERWVIEPLETGSSVSVHANPIVLYVVRPVSATLGEPEPGWYVRAAARYLGIAEIPDLPRTTESPTDNRYAAFIGATFDVTQHAGTSVSGAFAWIGLTVAVIFGVGIVLWWLIQKSRRRPSDADPSAAAAPAKDPPDAR